jgi:hypothetical protein
MSETEEGPRLMHSNEPWNQPGLDLELLAELQQLEVHLRDLGAVVADCFRPGLSRGEVDAYMDGSFERLPSEIVTWFAWHDGADETSATRRGDPWLPISLNLLSLDEALAAREEQLADWGPGGAMDPDPERMWQPRWLPLLGGGSLSLVGDLDAGEDQPVPVHRINFAPDVPWHDVQEPSIKAMVRVWNDHFAKGDHHWDAEQGGWTNTVYDPDHRVVM